MAAEGAALFLKFWNDQGQAHFRVEEEVLMPSWALLGTVDETAAAQLAREHLEIRTAALALAEATGARAGPRPRPAIGKPRPL